MPRLEERGHRVDATAARLMDMISGLRVTGRGRSSTAALHPEVVGGLLARGAYRRGHRGGHGHRAADGPHLRQAGAPVVLADRAEEGLEETAASLRVGAGGGRADRRVGRRPRSTTSPARRCAATGPHRRLGQRGRHHPQLAHRRHDRGGPRRRRRRQPEGRVLGLGGGRPGHDGGQAGARSSTSRRPGGEIPAPTLSVYGMTKAGGDPADPHRRGRARARRGPGQRGGARASSRRR